MSEPAKHPKPSSSIDWRRLHLWEIQPVRDLLVLAGIVGLIYVGYLIRVVTVPMLLALLLAYLFEPLVRWLRSRNVCSRRVAALGLIVLFGVLVVAPLGVGGTFAVIRGTEAAGTLASTISKVQKSIDSPSDPELKAAVPAGAWMKVRDYLAVHPPGIGEEEASDDVRLLARHIGAWVQEHGAELGKTIGSRVVGTSAQAVGVALGTLASIGLLLFTGALTAFFFYFFSTGWGTVLDFWEGLIPEKRRGRVIEIARQMDTVIAGFVRGRLIIVFILSIYFTIAYWIIGVPSAYILGPIIGAFCLVPYIAVVGMPIAMLLLWFNAPPEGGLHAHWWWIVFAPIAVHTLAQPLDDYVLTPKIQGKTTDLSVPMILFASLAGGALAGIYGLLIAIPMAACLRILLLQVFWPRFHSWVRGERTDFLPFGQD